MRTPRLEIYPRRIRQNADSIVNLCRSKGVSLACVTKVTMAHQAVSEALESAGADMLADSRIANLWALREQGRKGPFLLLRLPSPSEASELVDVADFSLNSSIVTLRAISDHAKLKRKIHKVIIMVDVGDLREGVWPDRLVPLIKEAKDFKGIEIVGLGCNLACYGGVIPSENNMKLLVSLRDACGRETALELPLLSGGNSSGLPLLASGKMPREINHFRVGEAIILGRNVIDRSPWPDTRQDTIKLVVEAVEVEKKPSVPIGERGQDAFGGKCEFVDRGVRTRAICNIGRQDVTIDGIVPIDGNMIVLGGSSDHLLLDVENAASPVSVGSEISFYPDYGALLALITSPFVRKVVVKDE